MAQGTGAPITRERITAVEQIIRPHIRLTPVLDLDGTSMNPRRRWCRPRVGSKQLSCQIRTGRRSPLPRGS